MNWEFNNDRPIYAQIVEHMKLFIVSGEIAPGSKVASVRELAAEAGVNPNTMQRALTELERVGLMYANRTSGRFVTEDNAMILKVKQELAEESIKAFLQNMQKIGYDRTQTISLIKKYDKGEEFHE